MTSVAAHSAPATGTILLVTQVYLPDPAAVGGPAADAAAELVQRGHRVVVLTADRAYDDPSIRFSAEELLDSVQVVRLPLSSFGKGSLGSRLCGGVSFVLQAQLRALLLRDLAGILVCTVPPFAAAAALPAVALRAVPLVYWVLDVNPDQAVAQGLVAPRSPLVRAFDALNRAALHRAAAVIALDRFMATRLRAKADISHKLHVVPPWPQTDHLQPVDHADNPFRREQGLEGKLVIMYSGNFSLVHPVDTILDTAARLLQERDLVFLFIGGGVRASAIAERIARDRLANVRMLPYQPFEQLRYSLSAADVHLVAMGDDMVGIVHPSKIYGALAVARPILFLGPRPCHISEILDAHEIGWQVRHGDVDGALRAIRAIRELGPEQRAAMGCRARAVAQERLSKAALCGELADIVERGIARKGNSPVQPG